jgi:hypothetical protein
MDRKTELRLQAAVDYENGREERLQRFARALVYVYYNRHRYGGEPKPTLGKFKQACEDVDGNSYLRPQPNNNF